MDGTGADAGVVYCEMQVRGRANMAHIRQSYKTDIRQSKHSYKTQVKQSRPYAGLGFDCKILEGQVRPALFYLSVVNMHLTRYTSV